MKFLSLEASKTYVNGERDYDLKDFQEGPGAFKRFVSFFSINHGGFLHHGLYHALDRFNCNCSISSAGDRE